MTKEKLGPIQRLKFEWSMFKEWYFGLADREPWAKRKEEELTEEFLDIVADEMEVPREILDDIDPPSQQGNDD